jgi:hypothetical protein
MGIENCIGDDDNDDDDDDDDNRINRGGSAVDVSVSRRPIIFDLSVLVRFQLLI